MKIHSLDRTQPLGPGERTLLSAQRRQRARETEWSAVPLILGFWRRLTAFWADLCLRADSTRVHRLASWAPAAVRAPSGHCQRADDPTDFPEYRTVAVSLVKV